MNIEFHYWITLFLALRAGIPDAEALKIAISSQFVDGSTESVRLLWAGKYCLIPATQSWNISDNRISKNIWLPFHFIPGNGLETSRLRIDKKENLLAVSPDSVLAKDLFIDALKSRDVYRIGIAAHAYADTWAHQNFCGDRDEYNAYFPNDPIPPICHAPAFKKPDELNEIWEDPRLIPTERQISNRERFLIAAEKIYKYFSTYARKEFGDWPFIEAELLELWGKGEEKGRGERYADYAILLDMEPYPENGWYGIFGYQPRHKSWTNGVKGFLDIISDSSENEADTICTSRDLLDKSDLSLWGKAAFNHLQAFNAYF